MTTSTSLAKKPRFSISFSELKAALAMQLAPTFEQQVRRRRLDGLFLMNLRDASAGN